LLFTDADCIFSPDALLFAVGAMAEYRSDVVSLMPDYIAKSIWEKLTIPLLAVIPLAFLPFALVRGTLFPVFAAANGAFLYLSRKTYFEVDGHRAVKSELAEDVKFSQHVKRRGKTLSYLDGKNVYKVRMYKNISELWTGFTRILLPAFDNLFVCFLGMFIVLNLFILPPVIACYGYAIGAPWASVAAATYLAAVGTRLLIVIALERDFALLTLLSPLSWLIAFVVACGSIYRSLSGTTEWKGRSYEGGSGK
jgi:ABC-type multidrug transport system fused ATPase/permease subunit